MATSKRPPLRLLLVDDDEPLRQTLARRLERQDMAVTQAGNGAEAPAKAVQGRFDVAVLDLHMPGMTGLELLEQLKTRQPDLEVLLLTAHGSIETAIRA